MNELRVILGIVFLRQAVIIYDITEIVTDISW